MNVAVDTARRWVELLVRLHDGKNGREVDFCVVRDGKPWFLVECKHAETALSPALAWFQKQTSAPHAFQAVHTLPFVAVDPFTRRDPCVIPTRTPSVPT